MSERVLKNHMTESQSNPETYERERRTKLLSIPDDLLVHVLNGKNNIDMSALPAGWSVHRCWYDHGRYAFVVEIYHDSFHVVPRGQCPPWIDVIYRRFQKGDWVGVNMEFWPPPEPLCFPDAHQ